MRRNNREKRRPGLLLTVLRVEAALGAEIDDGEFGALACAQFRRLLCEMKKQKQEEVWPVLTLLRFEAALGAEIDGELWSGSA